MGGTQRTGEYKKKLRKNRKARAETRRGRKFSGVRQRPRVGPHVELCPGCHRMRPIEEFAESRIDYDPMSPPPCCAECRERGIPAATVPMLTCDVVERKALVALFEGATVGEAARAAGRTKEWLKARLYRQNAPLKRAFQSLLRAAGLDEVRMVEMMREHWGAIEPKWNPADERWDFFPDYKTRQRVMEQTARFHELYPKSEPAGPGGAVVNIVTNIGLPQEEEGFAVQEDRREEPIDVTPKKGPEAR